MVLPSSRRSNGLRAIAVFVACAYLAQHAANPRGFAAPPRIARPAFGVGLSPPRKLSIRSAAESSATDSSESAASSWLKEIGLFSGYFFLQTGMGFMMKFVLSKVTVVPGLKGIPAPFFVTCCQQLVSFSIMCLVLLGSRAIGRPYNPQKISKQEMITVLCLAAAFSLNIGSNLLSMSLIPLSLSMIIRACSPITTAALQSMDKKQRTPSAPEWLCLLIGVVCAAAVTLAESGGVSGQASFLFFFGVAICVFSICCGGLDFVLKAKLGKGPKLNALDLNFYNALPVACFTGLAATAIPKPVSATWAARYVPQMTDLQVVKRMFQVNPSIVKWVVFSGLGAFVYNLYVTFMVVQLSPATSAFAGNFNKSAAILLSLVFLEGAAPWKTGSLRDFAKIGAVLGNIAAFTCYNILKKRKTAS